MRNLKQVDSDFWVWTAVFAGVVLGAPGCGGAKAPQSTNDFLVPNRAGIYTEATEHYGPLYVREVSADADESFVTADTQPWAGYWYPMRDSILVKPGAS